MGSYCIGKQMPWIWVSPGDLLLLSPLPAWVPGMGAPRQLPSDFGKEKVRASCRSLVRSLPLLSSRMHCGDSRVGNRLPTL